MKTASISDDVFDKMTDAINRAVDEIGDQTDEFVAAAAWWVLEKIK